MGGGIILKRNLKGIRCEDVERIFMKVLVNQHGPVCTALYLGGPGFGYSCLAYAWI
jgi:hypothetical protein